VQKHDNNRIKLFQESLKSPYTKKAYILNLKKYMDYLGVANNWNTSDPRKIEQSIIDYIIHLKKEKSYSVIHSRVAAILAFYKINDDVVLNTSKIKRFMPEQRKSNKDRSYTHQEIKNVFDAADERMKTVILLLASTGMRIGAIPELRLRNLEKISINSEFEIYKITVYEGDKEEHFTFTTPECSAVIDNYLDMRKRYGEKLFPSSYLIREQFDIRDPFAISKCQKTVSDTLGNKLADLAVRVGIRKKEILKKTEKNLGGSLRKDIAVCHGFRKFFTTQLVNSKINPEIREMLLGHKIGLAAVYYKPTVDDFVIEFQKAINSLTINEEYRLKMKVQKLEIEKSQLELLTKDVAMLKRKWKLK
jgi:integrase